MDYVSYDMDGVNRSFSRSALRNGFLGSSVYRALIGFHMCSVSKPFFWGGGMGERLLFFCFICNNLT